MSISNKFNIVLSVICAVLLGACVYAFGRYRSTAAEVAVYKRELTESKRNFENTIEQYRLLLDNTEANNERARTIVESMGSELQSNDTALRGTIEKMHTLRNYLKDLQDLYTSSSNSGVCRGNDVDVEDK